MKEHPRWRLIIMAEGYRPVRRSDYSPQTYDLYELDRGTYNCVYKPRVGRVYLSKGGSEQMRKMVQEGYFDKGKAK